ncbi:MAG: hypothetical protein V4773_22720 [Verrucomicrobiota bacterium]
MRYASTNTCARLLLLTLAGLGLTSAARALDPKSKWVRAKTDYVEVLSSASQKEAIEYALQYSAFRYVFGEMMGEKARQLPPTIVVLFRQRREFEANFPPRDKKADLVSVSYVADGQPLQAHALDSDRERALRLAFEFETTWAMPRLGYGLPVWAGQGTGKVFSTIKLRGGVCVLGDYFASSVDRWLVAPIPWPRFFDINLLSKEYSNTDGPGSYHSQAWAFMHYLWLSDGQGPERFQQLVERLRTEPEMQAALAVLKIPAADLTKTLSRYTGKMNRTRDFKIDEAAWRARMETGPADRALVGVHLSDLMRGFQQNDAAERELALARVAAPDHPTIREARAREAWARRDWQEALSLYREAIALNSTNFHAYIYSAEDWLNQSSSRGADEAGGGGTITETAIAELRRALQINPYEDHAYRVLARAFYVRPEITEEHLNDLQPGILLGDSTGLIRYYRALVYGRLKKIPEYQAALEALAAAPAIQASLRGEVAVRLGKIHYNVLADAVEKLAGEGRFPEARALVTQARATTLKDADFEQPLGKMVKWLDASERAKTKK